jgi:hypothetical protein
MVRVSSGRRGIGFDHPAAMEVAYKNVQAQEAGGLPGAAPPHNPFHHESMATFAVSQSQGSAYVGPGGKSMPRSMRYCGMNAWDPTEKLGPDGHTLPHPEADHPEYMRPITDRFGSHWKYSNGMPQYDPQKHPRRQTTNQTTSTMSSRPSAISSTSQSFHSAQR